MGMMQSIESLTVEPNSDRTPNPACTGLVFEAAKEAGLLVGKGGLYGNVLRIAPALNVTSDEIDEALLILGKACAQIPA